MKGKVRSMDNKLFRDGDKSTQMVLEIIEDFMRRVSKPVYLGFVSLEVGWSLARTQVMMEHLEELGKVRQLDEAENTRRGLRHDASAWMLV